MKPISIDLRERIVFAYDAGEGTQRQIAQRFKVSYGLVKKLLAQRNHLGTLEPQYHHVGRKPAFSGALLSDLERYLQRHGDATLEEIKTHFSGRVRCSIQAVANAINRLGWRYKKKHYAPVSKTGRMSGSSVGSGKKTKR